MILQSSGDGGTLPHQLVQEYLYIPLGGSRQNHIISIRNTFIVFLVSGFWHGANWTFIAWGAYNAIIFLPLLLANSNRKYLDGVESNAQIPRIKVLIQMGDTFLLVCVGWVLFRSENLTNAFIHLEDLIVESVHPAPNPSPNLLLMLFFSLWQSGHNAPIRTRCIISM